MGSHSASTTSSPSLPDISGAVTTTAAATGLTVLGLLAGTGAALASEASPADATGDPADSQCSVGGLPAGGSGTGSPDGVITNGHCSDEQIERAQHDADTDGDPTTRGSVDSSPTEEDTAGGNPNVVGGTGDGISSQSGTAQKVDGHDDTTDSGREPALADVL